MPAKLPGYTTAGAPAATAIGVGGLYYDTDDDAPKFSDGAAWQDIGSGGGGGAGRALLSANRTYYVRSDGSDGNTGLTNASGGAFLTLQKAIDVAATLDQSIYAITIRIGLAGTYAGFTVAAPFVGGPGSYVVVDGDTTAPGSYVLSSAVTVQDQGVLRIQGVDFTSSGWGITVQRSAIVQIVGAVIFGVCTSGHINSIEKGSLKIAANYTIDGGARWHIYCARQGYVSASVLTVTLTGTPAFASHFANASLAAVIDIYSNTFSGFCDRHALRRAAQQRGLYRQRRRNLSAGQCLRLHGDGRAIRLGAQRFDAAQFGRRPTANPKFNQQETADDRHGDVQRELKQQGFDPGPLDGAIGPRTRAAIIQFEKVHGLKADGAPDAAFLKLLLGAQDDAPWLPWFEEAKRRQGLHERRDRVELAAFLRSDGSSVGDPTKLPWCGHFVEPCMALALAGEPLPANPYLARNWLSFGIAVRADEGRGARLLARLEDRHVGPCRLLCRRGRGGFPRARRQPVQLRHDRAGRQGTAPRRRWPKTAPPPAGSRIEKSGSGALSTNEA